MKFAVAYVNLFDNELTVEVVEAETDKEALKKHSRLQDANHAEWMEGLPDDLEEIKDALFDGDVLVDSIPIE